MHGQIPFRINSASWRTQNYFQQFSRQGIPVRLGRVGPCPAGWTPVCQGMSNAHANALEIPCDPSSVLESVEFRATCSEGILGVAGMTAITAEGTNL